jgi:hypothetical protein
VAASGSGGMAAGGNAGRGGGGTAGSSSGGAGGGSGAGAGAGAGGTGGCSRRELLMNGSFDSGGTGWSETTKTWPSVIVTPEMVNNAVMPQSGTHLARLGSNSLEGDGLLAMVEIPATAKDLIFSYYSIVKTDDTSATANDVMNVALNSDQLWARDVLDNTKAHAEWQRFEHTVDPMFVTAGKMAVVLVRADSNDDMKATTFFVDSFSLTATVCP